MKRTAFLAAGAALAARPRVAAAQQVVTLRVGATVDDSVTPVLYAIQAGIFRELGLAVELRHVASGASLTSAVVGGAMDVGKSSLFTVVIAHARGVALPLVAGGVEYSTDDPSALLVVAKDAPIHSARDLDGKTASTPSLADLVQISTEAWVDANGGDSTTLKFVELPNPAVPEALASGRIDAATLIGPVLASALGSGKVRVLGKSFDAIAKHFLAAAWFCTPDFVAKNRETVRRFAAGVHRAAAFTNAHPAETAPLLAQFSKIPLPVVLKMHRAACALALDAADIQPTIDVAAKYKAIPGGFPAAELLAAL